MSKQQKQCFDQKMLNRFLDEQLHEEEESQIIAHLGECSDCQQQLDSMANGRGSWQDYQANLADYPMNATIGHVSSESALPSGSESSGESSTPSVADVRNLLAPTDDPAMLGRLGCYEICGIIGRGGTGVVFKALDTRLNRFVAIKMLAPGYSVNGTSRIRFEREARAIAAVRDDHVIPIHGVDDFNGTPYIVMQYMPSGSLQQRLDDKGPLTSQEVVRIGMQIASGLAAAHRQGIIHRDVKPANVLLEGGVERAVVTDFGLARVADEATMTHSGSISGTPQYMSPEQARGESLDPRSDLFSLGSVMHAACTGRAPFRSETLFGVINRVCQTRPRPIRETNPETAEWLAAFIEKLHSRNKEDRFESADEVVRILSQELAYFQAPTMVARPQRDWWVKPSPAPVVAEKPAKTKSGGFRKSGSGIFSTASVGGAAILSIIALGVSGWNGGFSLFSNGTPSDNPPVTSTGPMLSGTSLLNWTKQENEKLPRFENTVETRIDVQNGGQLFLRTNLGTLEIATHDKPTVEMHLVHTVAARDEETASKLFKAMKLEYGVDTDEAQDADLTKGRDAAIIATFPTRKLTEQEIEEADDLDELKEQLLIRNNSHHRNAEFRLLVPEEFSLDVQTSAGPIIASDIDGWARLVSHGGHIEAGNITGETNINTHGGHISVGNLGGNAKLHTQGGHIELGSVDGELIARTQGGHIQGDNIAGPLDAETMGGTVEFYHARDTVRATSEGGNVKIWKAEKQVNLEAPSGSVTVNFVKQPSGDSTMLSANGSIKIGYAQGLSFDVNATTGQGRVSGSFVESKTNQMQHQLNGGGPKLKATTGVGSIKFNQVDLNELEKRVEEMLIESQGQRAFQRAYDTHMDGRIDEALKLHAIAAGFDEYQGIATYNLGCAWALKGETDKAFEALNDAIEFGFQDVKQYQTDDDLDSLRKDERFSELMSRLTRSKRDRDHDHDQ